MVQLVEVSINAREFSEQLYKAVDSLSAEGVGAFLTPNVRFQLGNFDEIVGYDAVVEANRAFFQSIVAMSHTIKDAWTVDENVICTGYVHYTRHDKSTLQIPFSAVLKLKDNLISDYQVYVDVSPL
ncbi:hypothetical protein GCM10007094_36230 [Pseudovibrio japonicus]|uniref:SnoaL-like domain-containing protein n=1 Tax=Pseudovibrio japonicus TaxID=366534 RepID=A0ABQ3EJZ5_9HYPH|nr:nuclear transport factor 2 family protein [Pseudovibrio japonicus]GHB43562.1 hypothetical protein GCM10007094_36230 [Pseudovibrio japonicus]